MMEHLGNIIDSIDDPQRIAELHLSKTIQFFENLRSELEKESLGPTAIVNHLDRIQVQLCRLMEHKDQNSATGQHYGSRNDYVFVVMPFGENHIDTYDTIRRAVLKVGPEMVIERVDEKPGAITITEEICKSIGIARIVICDLTGERPNVYYELGYAHSLNKEVICVARHGTNIHFDVSGFKVLFFRTYRELEEILSTDLKRILHQVE